MKNIPKNKMNNNVDKYARKINGERERENVLWHLQSNLPLTTCMLHAVRFACISMHFLVHVLTVFDSCFILVYDISTRVAVLVNHVLQIRLDYIANQFVIKFITIHLIVHIFLTCLLLMLLSKDRMI